MSSKVICQNLTPMCLHGHVDLIKVYLSYNMASICNAVLCVFYLRDAEKWLHCFFFRRGECSNNNNALSAVSFRFL